MRKLVLSIIVSLCSILEVSGQLTFQHTYSNPGGILVVDLLLSGKKYCLNDVAGNQVILYNLNHTVWKTITPPAIPGLIQRGFLTGEHPSYGGNGFVSENLFKIDNKIDMALSYSDSGVAVSVSTLHLIVFDETGSIISRIDSIGDFAVNNIGVDSFVGFAYRNSHDVSVYSLPGKIPCNICGSGLGLGVPPSGNSGGSSLISNPVPNPSSGSVKIEYSVPPGTTGIIRVFNTMGKELKNYKVDHNFDYITLDNTELPSGIYYYNLTTSDMQTSAKKMIVVR